MSLVQGANIDEAPVTGQDGSGHRRMSCLWGPGARGGQQVGVRGSQLYDTMGTKGEAPRTEFRGHQEQWLWARLWAEATSGGDNEDTSRPPGVSALGGGWGRAGREGA